MSTETDGRNLGQATLAEFYEHTSTDLNMVASNITHGGIGVIHNLVNSLGLREMIDEWLQLLKQYRPYHESDHVLTFALNSLAGGRCLDDTRLLRFDEPLLDALLTPHDESQPQGVPELRELEPTQNERQIQTGEKEKGNGLHDPSVRGPGRHAHLSPRHVRGQGQERHGDPARLRP